MSPGRDTIRSLQRRHRPDYWLLVLGAVLLSLGLIVVYSIGPGLSAQGDLGTNYYVNKQLAAVGASVVAFIFCATLPLNWWPRLQKPLVTAALISAAAVQIFGEQNNGAYRWIQVGGLSFQAAELIKFALLIWLAGFLLERIREGTLGNGDKTFKPLLIVLLLLGIVVAKFQSDLGSMGVMVAIMAAMVFVAGMPLKKLSMIGGIILIGTVLAISTSGYRRERVQTFLNPTKDCQNAGYQSCQALIAVGTGGMFGLGLGRSVQAYGYTPEAANDSIFAIFGEMFGFAGTTVLIGLFVAFYSRLKRLIEHAPDDYTRLLLTGILAWLSTQTIINIGAMLGLLPLKGITLPFISYGGTSLLFVTAAVGVAFQISRYSTYGIARQTTRREGKGYERSNSPAVFRRV
jgi:cell division protein FtsW